MKKIVLGLFFYSITAYAAPEGFKLVSGQANPPQVDVQGQIHIQSTQDSVVHWQNFSLKPQETLIFDQAQETSRILNRVVGTDPSEILGNLQSNGIVYLINPNGILIGPEGVIQTAGFLASTLDVLTEDFFIKNTLELFSENPGSIINLGTISCPAGQITLLARNIDNQGELNGSVQAIACTKAILQIDHQRVFIHTNQELDTPEDYQELHTSLQKNPYAHAIKHSGRIKANSFSMQNGKAYLFAHRGTTDIVGDIEASDIKLLGKEVLLTEQATIDASKDVQGGTVLIGGSYKGQDTNIPVAEHVLIDTQVQIHADALQEGDGGEIIIWSKDNTEYLGSLSAKGGAVAGNGGFVEISGKKELRFEGAVDLTAANGKTGSLLIDPDFINITPGGTDPATGQTFNTTGTVNISGADIGTAINTANLILQANRDISIGDNITAATAGNGLTLQAGSNITNIGTIAIRLNEGSFSATFNDEGAGIGGGFSSFTADNLTITTAGGDINIQQGNLAGVYNGLISLFNCTCNAGSGAISLTVHPNNSVSAAGITLNGVGLITTGGAILLNGAGDQGVAIENSGNINAGIGSGSVAIVGQGNKGIGTFISSSRVLGLEINIDGTNGIQIGQGSSIRANGSISLSSTLGGISLEDLLVRSGTGVLNVNAQGDFILEAITREAAMRARSGLANFTIGGNLVLISGSAPAANARIGTGMINPTGGSFQFTVGGNVLLTASNAANSALIGYGGRTRISNVSGDIIFNHVGGDIVLQGANSGTGASGFAQIGHLSGGSNINTLNGNVSLLVDGSISVIGGNANASSYAQIGHGGSAAFTTAGQLTAIAGKNIIMQSNAAPANIVNAGGNITLVVDNLFPTTPLIGPGFFSIQSNLSASEELRIYTATRSQNQIDDLINGSPFIPGTLFVNTSEEMWSIYYPGGIYGGGPFTIYYKDGTIEAIEDTFQFAVDNAELSDLLPLVHPPIYQAKLDYFSLKELVCFDPYHRVLRYRMDRKNLTR